MKPQCLEERIHPPGSVPSRSHQLFKREDWFDDKEDWGEDLAPVVGSGCDLGQVSGLGLSNLQDLLEIYGVINAANFSVEQGRSSSLRENNYLTLRI